MSDPSIAIHRPERMGTPRLAPLAVTAAVLGLTAAGCGSSSGTNSSQASQAVSEPPATMVAQANAICGRLNRQLDAEKIASIAIGELARAAPHRAVLESQTLRELKALTPPTQLAREWEQLISFRQTLALELAQLANVAKANNKHAVNALAVTKKRIHSELRKLAEAHGFSACGRTG